MKLINTIDDLINIYNVKPYYLNGNVLTTYMVSPSVEIFNTKNNKIKQLKPIKQSNGYYLIHLHYNGKSYYRWHHRIIAEVFIPNPNKLPQVNHKDGIKSHNYDSNLEWVSSKENVQHAFIHNLRKYGEGSSNASISNEAAIKICKMLEENKKSPQEIAKHIGCSINVVRTILSKESWTHISKNYNIENYNAYNKNRGKHKLNEEDVVKICKLLKEGKMSGREIASMFNAFENTIYRIKNKKCWKDIANKYL